MATKEITKQDARFGDPQLEQELVIVPEEPAAARKRMVSRLAFLWENRQFLVRCTAVGFGLSILMAFLIPVRYTSTTRLMPPDQTSQGVASMLAALGKTGDFGSIGGDLLGLKTSGDLFVGVLHSRSVQDDVINKLDLRKVYGVQRYEDARKTLDGRTEISADRKSGIITLKASDGDPNRAAGIGVEYVAALNRVVITLNTSSAHKERVFLEDRLVTVQQDLEKAEKDFSKFASQNTAIDVKEQGRAMIGATAELEGQLIAAETQLQGLQQIYAPNNVRIRSMQARIDEYRRQLQRLGGTGVATGTAGTDSVNQSAGQVNDLYPSIRQLPILGVEWADLFRETKIQEAILETLTKQYELAKVEEARETPSVKVLDAADVPERKSYPPRSLLIFFGTGFAVVLASAWLLGRARWQAVDAEDPMKMLVRQMARTIRSGTGRIWPYD